MDPVIDFPAVLERVEDDRELLGELARLFLEELPERLSLIADALEARDAKGLHEVAHALKGSAGNLAAMAVFEAAKQLEHSGQTADWGQAATAYAALRRELERLTPALTELISPPPQ